MSEVTGHKISDLTALTAENITDNDLLYIVNSSESKKTTVGSLKDKIIESTFRQKTPTTNNNLIYDCYETGWYAFGSDWAGIPLAGYGGVMLTFDCVFAKIKIAVLNNGWVYALANSSDGTLLSGWNKINSN